MAKLTAEEAERLLEASRQLGEAIARWNEALMTFGEAITKGMNEALKTQSGTGLPPRSILDARAKVTRQHDL